MKKFGDITLFNNFYKPYFEQYPLGYRLSEDGQIIEHITGIGRANKAYVEKTSNMTMEEIVKQYGIYEDQFSIKFFQDRYNEIVQAKKLYDETKQLPNVIAIQDRAGFIRVYTLEHFEVQPSEAYQPESMSGNMQHIRLKHTSKAIPLKECWYNGEAIYYFGKKIIEEDLIFTEFV